MLSIISLTSELIDKISFHCRKYQLYSHIIFIEFTAYDKINQDSTVSISDAGSLFQAVSDIERQWVQGTKDQIKHLNTLQQRGSKREVISSTCRFQDSSFKGDTIESQ